jgi:hypothetical protein
MASDEVPGGGPYSPGPNKYTGGGTTPEDVTPLDVQPDATEEGKEKRDSVSRQLGS